MDTTGNASISIQKRLLAQAEALAQRLNISQNELFERAIADFISQHPMHPTPAEGRIINQGDVYWVQLENQGALDTGIPHPYVVIQDNLFNYSRITSVVICALTSNIRRVSDTPGNVLLDVGEANLPKQSVVEVSKVSTVEMEQLGEYIGSLNETRVAQILAGMRFLQMTFFNR
jgi:mRNA interferase MazF